MGFRFLSNLKPVNGAYIYKIITSSKPQRDTNFIPAAAQYYHPIFSAQRRWLVGHSHDHDHSGKKGERIFQLGLAADIGLAAGKAFTGYFTGSTAIIADAVHSLSDVVLSGVALLSYKASVVPKDKEHPYGHGKFETLGALTIAGVLVATGGGIAWHAFDVLLGIWSTTPELVNGQMHSHSHGGHHHGIDLQHPVLAINMSVVAIVVKEGLFWITMRAGERAGSGLMTANAWHHRTDAISSVVALIGVGGAYLGLPFLDPVAGLAVAGMILEAGIRSGYRSVLELVDAALPSQELEPFKHTILQVEGVKGCNHLRARRAGSYLYLDLDIEVDPFSSVSAAHNVGENVRCQVQKNHPQITEVFTRIVPSTSDVANNIKDTRWHTEMANQVQDGVFSSNTDIKDIVSNILASKFAEKMVVERVIQHILQEKTLLEIEVSMPHDIFIRDAAKMANEAEKHIMKEVPNIQCAYIQLQLGHSLHHDLQQNRCHVCDS